MTALQVACFDRDLRLVFQSAAPEADRGLPLERYLAFGHVGARIAAGAVKRFESAAREVLSTARPITLDVEAQGGRKFQAQLLPGYANGRVEFVQAVIKEIGRATENEVPRSSAFRRIFDSNLIGIGCWQDPDLVTQANEVLLGLWGMDRERLAAGPIAWSEILPPEERQRQARLFAELSDSGWPAPVELTFQHSSGERVPVLLGAATWEGEPHAGIFFVIDIRERKYQEQSYKFLVDSGKVLASSLDYEETLAEVSRIAVPRFADWCVMDVVEEDASVNRIVVAYGDPAHAPIAESLKRRLDRDAASLADVHAPCTATDLTPERFVELVRDRATHPGMHGLAALAPLGIRSFMVQPMVARGTHVGAITFLTSRWNYDHKNESCARELAQRAAIAIDNARLYRESQAAIRVRDEFVSVASHELKTPITSLQLRVQLLSRLVASPSAESQEALASSLSATERQVQRLGQITNELLDVARLTAGRLQIELEPLDLASLLREIAERFEADLKRAGVRLTLEAPPSVAGRFDRIRCDQIITNLLSNAVKYGRGEPIEVRLAATDDEVELTVRDHGIGISPENLARIFGRFERAVSQRNFGGLGLGLWITRSAIEAMHGTIAVESEVGEGAEFRVRLPRHLDSDATHPTH